MELKDGVNGQNVNLYEQIAVVEIYMVRIRNCIMLLKCSKLDIVVFRIPCTLCEIRGPRAISKW